MRTAAGCVGMCLVTAIGPACDKSGPLADVDAGAPWPGVAATTPSQAASAALASADAAPPGPARVMPPRPVPTTNPTVRVTMPMETQLQAIQYMAAMQAPQPSDAPADATYAAQVASALKPLGAPEVDSGGRVIHVTMAKGCGATVPREAITHATGSSLPLLLAHGVLVVRCADREVECLQSTRDATDVLCAHK